MVTVAAYLGIFFVLLTRYGSIFHSNHVAPANDLWAIKIFSVITTITPVIFGILEFTLITNINEVPAYHVLHFDDLSLGMGSSNEVIRTLITILDLILITILEARIEYDHLVLGEHSGILVSFARFSREKLNKLRNHSTNKIDPEDPNKELIAILPYNLRVIRGFFAIGLMVVGLLAYNMTVGTSNVRYNYFGIYTIYSFLCPWVFVWNHKRMRKLAINRLKSSFCYTY